MTTLQDFQRPFYDPSRLSTAIYDPSRVSTAIYGPPRLSAVIYDPSRVSTALHDSLHGTHFLGPSSIYNNSLREPLYGTVKRLRTSALSAIAV